jgi:FkbM family methyltransferase
MKLSRKHPTLFALYKKTKNIPWNFSKLFLPFVRIKVEGVKLFLNPNDEVISRKCFLRHKWESLEIKKMKERIAEGSICLDIGANIGIYTCIMEKEVGRNGMVFAFEPSLENYIFLRKNSQGKKNVIIENTAISNINGETTLFISSKNKGDHRLYQPQTEDNRETNRIKTVTLSKYLEDNSVPLGDISVIKIDTQGTEPYILKGAEAILRKLVNTTFFIEFWPRSYEEQDINRKEYLKFLFDNFKIHDLNHILGSFKEISSFAEIENLYESHMNNLNNIAHSTLMLEQRGI